jgi:hypothetical protein
LWLNRHLVEIAMRQATGRPCFRGPNNGLDGVLVSDVGKAIEVQPDQRMGGFLATAMRSTDILMDRVWQLEMETFQDTPGYIFAPVTQIVDPHDDPTALHPEVQRQVANIRTDLDRFSPLEISTLVRHGYCVARLACKTHPGLFKATTHLPDGPPWEPGQAQPTSATVPAETPQSAPPATPASTMPATAAARELRPSASRRIWSTLWDSRDWMSYVYVPIILPILLLIPYWTYKSYQRSHRLNALVASLSQGSHDLEKMYELIEADSTRWASEQPEEVDKVAPPTTKGFEILQDSRIIDLRQWKPGKAAALDGKSWGFAYRRVKVLKTPEKQGDSHYNMIPLPISPNAGFRFPNQELAARLRRSPVVAGAEAEECNWQITWDFKQVVAGDHVDLLFEYYYPGRMMYRSENSSGLPFEIDMNTAELTAWILMPRGKDYRAYSLIRYPAGKPDKVENVKIVTEYLAQDTTILAFKLLSLEAGFIYEVRWSY